MTIQASYSMPATSLAVCNAATGGNSSDLSARFKSVGNSSDNVLTPPSLMKSISDSAAKLWDLLGLKKLGEGLTWVSNAAGGGAQLSQYAVNVAQMAHSGVKIVQYGVKGLVYEVMMLLKDQALPILECWVNKVCEAGENVTLSQVLKSLMECIQDNKEIRQLFKNITAA